MDEAEKYKQRLEAIAEKRRQQEEEDRARREMEDEKLRLQQLKRKSLRDQWLMEGAPLSPASPDAQSPRSPPWGSQNEEMETHADKLQPESERLAEEKEKEQMEDGQLQETVKVAEAGAEVIQDVVVQNGENAATASETTDDEVKTNKIPLLEGTAVVLTNGGGDSEATTNHGAPELESIRSNANGPVGAARGVQAPRVSVDEEEEEGTLVIRAECVIITDEGDDAPEDLTPQEDQQESARSEETPLPNGQAGEAGTEVEEVVKTEAAPETFTQPECSEATEPAAEAPPAAEGGGAEGDVKTNENGDGGAKAEGQGEPSEDPTSAQLLSPAAVVEGTAVVSVPVYSEAQPSALAPEPEGDAATSPEGADVASQAQDPATAPGQFQEVPLADPQENRRTEAVPEEREPLLSQAKAPGTQAEAAAADGPVEAETLSPARASQGDETGAPKRKTCQCCSLM